ncbi:hypothetical protein RvY_11508 [Ramazzottius varieornatus]|uniref:Uncharacterized protein n=1 Tax=Ramazzottius varieornatus TaxID=947166 RepID=A0A1D1VGC5_RAMVA|nr:hypothetical protein RvY_11508 [Ramazzottius varieornatus]
MADKDDFDKLPNKNACGVFMPIKKLDAAYSKDGDFQQTERCYCMSNKCNTWQVKDRRTGIVQQEKSAFSTDNAGNTANSDDPEKPASETPGNATGTDSGGLSGISSASSVKFGHAGMGEPSFYRFLWPSVLVVMVHVVRSLLCPADTS